MNNAALHMVPAAKPFLTDEEITVICRPIKKPATQIQFLTAAGVTAHRRPDGTALVFRRDADGIQDKCFEERQRRLRHAKSRYPENVAKRNAALKQRTPAWANMDEIDRIYGRALRLTRETGLPHHVDHEIPLRGELVSGLHVHNNLQIISRGDNLRKGRRFEVA